MEFFFSFFLHAHALVPGVILPAVVGGGIAEIVVPFDCEATAYTHKCHISI